jgi:hypothetical protein
MARIREGRIVERDGKIHVRVRYSDENGQRKDRWYQAKNRSKARSLLKEKINELDTHGARTLDAERMTFTDLAKHFEDNYVTEPIYVDGRKISGLRSHRTMEGLVNSIKAHFGKKRLRSITHGDIRAFKALRLKTPKRNGEQRSIATGKQGTGDASPDAQRRAG